jgi:Aminotransferase class-V
VALQHISMDQAVEFQHRLVDIFQQEFDGNEQLMAGDYGVVKGLNRPRFTAKVERVLARFFEAPDCTLVRGAGTGSIRLALATVLKPGDEVIIHKPPVYPTSLVTMEIAGYQLKYVDMNDVAALRDAVGPQTKCVYIQHTYQNFDDTYDVDELVAAVKGKNPSVPVVIDDNYAVMKTSRIGIQLGADLSAFSLFKILGPEGVGCVIGRQDLIAKIREFNYSGGSQVQGPEAMEGLRALVYAPVQLALTTDVIHELQARLAGGEVPRIKVHEAAIQGLHIVIEFEEPIADRVLEVAPTLGALPHPVGAESQYEVGCMLYRMSATFRNTWPDRARSMIRIVPMRSGADTVIRILTAALQEVGYIGELPKVGR